LLGRVRDVDEHTRGVRIVEASDDDVGAIGRLFWRMWDEAGPDAPGFSGATEDIVAEIAEPDAIRARIGGSRRRMFIAYSGDDAVGFAATRTVDTVEIDLAGIVVLQSMLGSGIGTPLVEAAVAAARREGFARMTVSTEVDNERALTFYEARGFRKVGESTTDVEGTVVAVSNMVLDL
jgi:ribosomal protein S18 acetylase RimI-like enzyme